MRRRRDAALQWASRDVGRDDHGLIEAYPIFVRPRVLNDALSSTRETDSVGSTQSKSSRERRVPLPEFSISIRCTDPTRATASENARAMKPYPVQLEISGPTPMWTLPDTGTLCPRCCGC